MRTCSRVSILLGIGCFVGCDGKPVPKEVGLYELDPGSAQAISGINEIVGDEAARRAARVDARFVNTAMMATLLGSVISDGLEDGRVVSGVGGQYNFVAQAFALEGARSIISIG